MHIALKIALGIPALLFAFVGLGWATDPAGTAPTFGMPLLEGAGLSTQVGDLSAFFFTLSAMLVIGIYSQQKVWFQAAAMLLLLTAVFRTVAWAAHGATFETQSIAIEVIVGTLALVAASKASLR